MGDDGSTRSHRYFAFTKSCGGCGDMRTIGRKEKPPARMRGAFLLIGETKLLSLTENTVDLGSAHWADALCHAAT
jgi:hypothetical protein